MDNPLTPHEAILACRDAAGSDSQFARDLRVPQSSMWRWLNEAKQLPTRHVLAAERLYGISRHWLDPMAYPIESPGVVPAGAPSGRLADAPDGAGPSQVAA